MPTPVVLNMNIINHYAELITSNHMFDAVDEVTLTNTNNNTISGVQCIADISV